jgi:hypothetical protein
MQDNHEEEMREKEDEQDGGLTEEDNSEPATIRVESRFQR